MSEKPRLDRIRALAEAHPGLQQHGQPESDHVHMGATACTHVICQFLSLVWHGKVPSLNKVNSDAKMPKNAMGTMGPRGMLPSEFKQYLKTAKIPMTVMNHVKFADLLKASDNGPVFYAMRYGSAPPKSPTHPNGTTQTGGDSANTRHAVVMLGFREFAAPGGGKRIEVYRKEPNHGSMSRPEKPPYDTISDRQARIEYEDYRDKLGQSLYAAVPNEKFDVELDLPALNLAELQPGSGFATVKDGSRSAVRISDQKRIPLPAGTSKRVLATARLVPPLDSAPGDREHVVLVGDEAAVLLRMDVTLSETDPNQPLIGIAPEPSITSLAPEPIELPEGEVLDVSKESETMANEAFAAD